MQKAIPQENIIQTYLDSSNFFYQDLLGYKPKQTSLQQIPETEWNKFAETRGLNQNSFGVYLPRSQTAVIQEENPLSLFHEYFGHGLYCEQSLAGRKLVSLERELLKEEREEFQDKQFTLEDIQGFRKQNQTFQELDEFRKQNLGIYEGFALFSEFLLSEKFDLIDIFEKKYEDLSQENQEHIEKIIFFNKQYGNLATFYSFGLARKTTPERVKKLLEDIYKDELQDVRFALLYGSKKEFSDIDVFVVSDNLPEIKTNWLDVRICSPKEFKEGIMFFDIPITDPILTGKIIIGDREYFENKKRKLFNQPIVEEAIKYNLAKSEEQKKLALNYPDNSEERNHGLSYSQTYLKNALLLKQGKRFLTKKDLYSLSENHIKLKGGIR